MDSFIDRTTGLSSITSLVVNDSFVVREITAEVTKTQNLFVTNPFTVNGLSSTDHVSIDTGKNLTVGGIVTTNGLTSNENVTIASGKNLTVGGTVTTNGLASNENVTIATGKNLTVGGTVTTNGLISNENVTIATGKNLTVGGNLTISGSFIPTQLSQSGTKIAIGSGAGTTNQGTNAIAIGTNAGTTNQGNGTIVLNASGSTLNGATANACFINPIRSVTTGSNSQTGHVYYSTSTNECMTSSNVKQFDPNTVWPSNSGCIGEVQFGPFTTRSITQSGENVFIVTGSTITLNQGLWQIQSWSDISGSTSPTKYRIGVANASGSGYGSNISGVWASNLIFNQSGSTSNIGTSQPIVYYVATPMTFYAGVNVVTPSATYTWNSYIQAIRLA
jgi:hypothetical protein